jgi:1-acyl-sn-glycerol-3-phosphate acyltransferase
MDIPLKWHALFHAFIRRLFFSRLTVTGDTNVPAEGPVLALCLHRNGAVDAFLYRKALPQLNFMVKAELRKSLIGKLFFDGIEVTRKEDGGKHDNLEAIGDCLDLLANGGWLGIFPEGTSGLGPRHLPFRSGAARIALRHHDSGRPLTVLPLGIHYECAWGFRSRAEIVIGPPVVLDMHGALVSPGARLLEVKKRFAAALESVGTNFADAAAQELARKFAYIATLGTGLGYFEALKAMERLVPPDAVCGWESLEANAGRRRVLRHQGVPLFPLRRSWTYVLAVLLAAPLVMAGFLVNVPPLAVAWWAGKRFPDDANVIALWRILTGVPVLVLWAAAWCAVGIAAGLWWLPPLYFALTWLAVSGWYRLKKLTVVAWNGLFHADLRPLALAAHRAVLNSFEPPSHESPDLVKTAAA